MQGTALGEPLEALARHLQVPLGKDAPNLEQPVRALEGRYGLSLPDDFRRYLVNVSPPFDYDDEEYTTWWAVGRIRNIPEEFGEATSNPEIAAEAESYLFFADYLVWCWAWAICCSDGPNRGRVAFIGGPDGFVADSFIEFVERYLSDPNGMANTFPEE